MSSPKPLVSPRNGTGGAARHASFDHIASPQPSPRGGRPPVATVTGTASALPPRTEGFSPLRPAPESDDDEYRSDSPAAEGLGDRKPQVIAMPDMHAGDVFVLPGAGSRLKFTFSWHAGRVPAANHVGAPHDGGGLHRPHVDVDSSAILFGADGTKLDHVSFGRRSTRDRSVVHVNDNRGNSTASIKPRGDDAPGRSGTTDDVMSETIAAHLGRVDRAVEVMALLVNVYTQGRSLDDVHHVVIEAWDVDGACEILVPGRGATAPAVTSSKRLLRFEHRPGLPRTTGALLLVARRVMHPVPHWLFIAEGETLAGRTHRHVVVEVETHVVRVMKATAAGLMKRGGIRVGGWTLPLDANTDALNHSVGAAPPRGGGPLKANASFRMLKRGGAGKSGRTFSTVADPAADVLPFDADEESIAQRMARKMRQFRYERVNIRHHQVPSSTGRRRRSSKAGVPAFANVDPSAHGGGAAHRRRSSQVWGDWNDDASAISALGPVVSSPSSSFKASWPGDTAYDDIFRDFGVPEHRRGHNGSPTSPRVARGTDNARTLPPPRDMIAHLTRTALAAVPNVDVHGGGGAVISPAPSNSPRMRGVIPTGGRRSSKRASLSESTRGEHSPDDEDHPPMRRRPSAIALTSMMAAGSRARASSVGPRMAPAGRDRRASLTCFVVATDDDGNSPRDDANDEDSDEEEPAVRPPRSLVMLSEATAFGTHAGDGTTLDVSLSKDSCAGGESPGPTDPTTALGARGQAEPPGESGVAPSVVGSFASPWSITFGTLPLPAASFRMEGAEAPAAPFDEGGGNSDVDESTGSDSTLASTTASERQLEATMAYRAATSKMLCDAGHNRAPERPHIVRKARRVYSVGAATRSKFDLATGGGGADGAASSSSDEERLLMQAFPEFDDERLVRYQQHCYNVGSRRWVLMLEYLRARESYRRMKSSGQSVLTRKPPSGKRLSHSVSAGAADDAVDWGAEHVRGPVDPHEGPPPVGNLIKASVVDEAPTQGAPKARAVSPIGVNPRTRQWLAASAVALPKEPFESLIHNLKTEVRPTDAVDMSSSCSALTSTGVDNLALQRKIQNIALNSKSQIDSSPEDLGQLPPQAVSRRFDTVFHAIEPLPPPPGSPGDEKGGGDAEDSSWSRDEPARAGRRLKGAAQGRQVGSRGGATGRPPPVQRGVAARAINNRGEAGGPTNALLAAAKPSTATSHARITNAALPSWLAGVTLTAKSDHATKAAAPRRPSELSLNDAPLWNAQSAAASVSLSNLAPAGDDGTRARQTSADVRRSVRFFKHAGRQSEQDPNLPQGNIARVPSPVRRYSRMATGGRISPQAVQRKFEPSTELIGDEGLRLAVEAFVAREVARRATPRMMKLLRSHAVASQEAARKTQAMARSLLAPAVDPALLMKADAAYAPASVPINASPKQPASQSIPPPAGAPASSVAAATAREALVPVNFRPVAPVDASVAVAARKRVAQATVMPANVTPQSVVSTTPVDILVTCPTVVSPPPFRDKKADAGRNALAEDRIAAAAPAAAAAAQVPMPLPPNPLATTATDETTLNHSSGAAAPVQVTGSTTSLRPASAPASKAPTKPVSARPSSSKLSDRRLPTGANPEAIRAAAAFQPQSTRIEGTLLLGVSPPPGKPSTFQFENSELNVELQQQRAFVSSSHAEMKRMLKALTEHQLGGCRAARLEGEEEEGTARESGGRSATERRPVTSPGRRDGPSAIKPAPTSPRPAATVPAKPTRPSTATRPPRPHAPASPLLAPVPTTVNPPRPQSSGVRPTPRRPPSAVARDRQQEAGTVYATGRVRAASAGSRRKT